MSISSNQYLQLHDYLTQLLNLNLPGRPIQQQTIAKRLHIAPSSVCRFLGNKTAAPKKMMSNFAVTYPLEVQKWPKNLNKINRVLQESDARYFLGLKNPAPQPPNPTPSLEHSLQQTPKIHDTLPAPNFPREPAAPSPFVTQPRSRTIAPISVPRPGPSHTLRANSSRMPKPTAQEVLISKPLKAPIAISYRGHLSDKDAGGMLFDHIRFQSITDYPTHALLPEEANLQDTITKLFISALRNHPASLPHGIQNIDMIKHPPFTQSSADLGLLIIPGRIHKIENEPVRLKHEYQVIREALNRGQPLLGICAGSWRIWEQLSIWTKQPDYMSTEAPNLVDWHEESQTLVDVTDHTYGGGMIRLDKMGIKATYNIQIHDVVFQKGSWIKAALKTKKLRISVNSVHWKAVNSKELPLNIKISGLSAQNPLIKQTSRQKNLVEPQENEVEAFESIDGAPIAGIQWHPEGYNYNEADGPLHSNLVKYMALAGSAYAAKRRMLSQLPKKDL